MFKFFKEKLKGFFGKEETSGESKEKKKEIKVEKQKVKKKKSIKEKKEKIEHIIEEVENKPTKVLKNFVRKESFDSSGLEKVSKDENEHSQIEEESDVEVNDQANEGN